MNKITMITTMFLTTGILCACTPSTDNPVVASPSDYFPILENTSYSYLGEGNEYASYTTIVDYTSADKYQLRINNGGTVMVEVIGIADNQVQLLYSQGETYHRENFLDQTNESPEILLKGPIETGTTWTLSDGSTRSITAIDVSMETGTGTYSAIEVTTSATDYSSIDYYAKDVGLIKTINIGNGYEVTSTLDSIAEEAQLIQNIAFHYPNINDGNIYYQSREIAFDTNDVTRLVLQEAYKSNIPADVGPVFTTNTKINWYYLNQDGMVYIDLSSDYISEMNAGAGYESMMLQCIANTFGGYYSIDRVILTIDGGLYESGHIALEQFEYLTADLDSSIMIAP